MCLPDSVPKTMVFAWYGLAQVPCEPLICNFYSSSSEYSYYSSYIR